MFKSKISFIFIIPILISLSISLTIFFSSKVDLVKTFINLENNCYASPRIVDVASNLMRKGYIVQTQLIDKVNNKFSTYDCKKNHLIRIKYISKYQDFIFASINNEFEYISRLEKIKLSNQIIVLDEIINSSLFDYNHYYFEQIKNYFGDKLLNKIKFNESEVYQQKLLLRQEQKKLQSKLKSIGKIKFNEFPVETIDDKNFLKTISIFLFLSIFFIIVFYSLFKLSVIKLK